MSLVFIDTETTGLLPHHQIWEMAYAVDNGKINSGIVAHTVVGADEVALKIGNYDARGGSDTRKWNKFVEYGMWTALKGNTLVAANPHFDATKLEARWGVKDHWNYRMIDLESMAVGKLHDGEKMIGLNGIRERLLNLGFEIAPPNHTAAGDVACLRSCFYTLLYLNTKITAGGKGEKFKYVSSAQLDMEDRLREGLVKTESVW